MKGGSLLGSTLAPVGGVRCHIVVGMIQSPACDTRLPMAIASSPAGLV